jgi:hypothetical protein
MEPPNRPAVPERGHRKPPKHVHEEPEPLVPLPDGVVPAGLEKKKTPKKGKKARKEPEPEPDVEEWDMDGEVEEFDEELEEVPEVLVVECRCGNEIEVEDGSTRFVCPECGRSGKLKK